MKNQKEEKDTAQSPPPPLDALFLRTSNTYGLRILGCPVLWHVGMASPFVEGR